MTQDSWLVRGVRLLSLGTEANPAPDPVDLRIEGGRIAEIGPDLKPTPHLRWYEGHNHWAVPGLWDHHVHLGQWALMQHRLDLTTATSVAQVQQLLRAELERRGRDWRRTATGQPALEVIQGFGHRPATWSDQPTVAALDEISPTTPVVLISGDAHHGWLNSAALRALQLPPRDDVVVEAEWFAAYPRLAQLPGAAAATEAGIAAAIQQANRRGVTGLVDLEFAPNHRRWPQRSAAGLRGVRVRTGVYPPDLPEVLAAGLRTGDVLDEHGLVTMGPVKVITDGSLNTRTAWCCTPYADSASSSHPRGIQNVAPAELVELLVTAQRAGLHVAVHAIGDAAVSDALDAFAITGARGSIEHVQLIADSDITRLAELGITASVQPAHLLDDREVCQQCWPDRMERCFRFASLLQAGTTVVLGSDAPISPLDPWLAIAAAVHRGQPDQAAWHEQESLTVREALACSTGGVNQLAVGAPADFFVTPTNPLAVTGGAPEQSAALREWPVTATWTAGQLVWVAG